MCLEDGVRGQGEGWDKKGQWRVNVVKYIINNSNNNKLSKVNNF